MSLRGAQNTQYPCWLERSETGRQHDIIAMRDINILFWRTFRVPDTTTASLCPPKLGTFPLSQVDGPLGSSLPAHVRARGGVFFPMHDREAMVINIKALKPFAIKIYTGQVNVVSGRLTQKVGMTNVPQSGVVTQDYVVAPLQCWVNGFATGADTGRQFIATPQGTGYSVEAQIMGTEEVASIRFEVTPLRTFEVPVFSSKKGKMTSFRASLTTTVEEVKNMISVIEDESHERFRILCDGSRLLDGQTLEDLDFQPGDGLDVHFEQIAGGPGREPVKDPGPQLPEMRFAAGGLIPQRIYEDPHDRSEWQVDKMIVFNVQVINASIYSSLTGLSPPPCPVDDGMYTARGLLPFNSPGASSNISGNFEGIESHDTIRMRREFEDWLNLNPTPTVALNPQDPLVPQPDLMEE